MTEAPRRPWRWVAWVVLAVVVGVALAVGAGHPAGPPSAAQRAARIEAGLRCPSCAGISVANSSASTAAAIRQAVSSRVRAGQSDAQIEAYVVSRYGPSILLRPPAHGPTVWVWVLPPLAVGLAGAALGALFWRRRRVGGAPVSDDDRALVDRALVERALVDRALETRAVAGGPAPRRPALGHGAGAP